MQLANIIDPRFGDALGKLSALQVPLATALKIKAIVNDVARIAAFYEQTRKDLLTKHGIKNEDGSPAVDEAGNIRLEPDAMKEFVAEITSLLGREFAITTIKAAELPDFNVSAVELSLLRDVVLL